jgi:nucleotidyltransferase substrate binding protein (TIGR01987 family)
MQDVRSKQRFENFKKALKQYESAAATENLSQLEAEGLIQRFEYTFELAWKCLQDLLFERGYSNVRGPRPVIEQSFKDGLLQDGVLWLEMLKARNETTHLYEETILKAITQKVIGPFLKPLQDFKSHFPQ